MIRFQIVAVTAETPLASTYTLRQLSGETVNFLPGQFLTFVMEVDEMEQRRSYSLVSLPGEPLRVTVKRVANGAVSRHILSHWKTGDEVLALPPAGRFVLPPSETARDLFFFAAGSGITPIIAHLRYLLLRESQSAFHLYYSNRDEKDILFADVIRRLQNQYPRFQVRHFLSEPLEHPETRQRLNNGNLEQLLGSDFLFARENAVMMICGPFGYMRMVNITLRFMHIAESQIKKENFVAEALRNGTFVRREFPEQTILLRYNGQEHRLPVVRNQSILRAALAAGIPLPYSCEGGVCSTCAVRCVQGKVSLLVNEVLTNDELAQGWILTCTGHPESDDVVIVA